MPMENTAVAGTVAVVGLGTTIFTSFMPKMPELRTANMGLENSTQVRNAQVLGTAATLSFAGVVSYWSKSSVPLIAGAVTVLVLSAIYEYTLKAGSDND